MERDHELLSVLPLKATSGVLFKVLGTFRLPFLSRGKGCSANRPDLSTYLPHHIPDLRQLPSEGEPRNPLVTLMRFMWKNRLFVSPRYSVRLSWKEMNRHQTNL